MTQQKKNHLKEVPMFPIWKYNETEEKDFFTGKYEIAHFAGEYKHKRLGKDLHTGYPIYVRLEPVMTPNTPFYDKLTFKDYYKGRSAAGLIFESTGGQKYHVFMVDAKEMIPKMVLGIIEGTFRYDCCGEINTKPYSRV